MKKLFLILLLLLFSTSSYALIADIGINPLDQSSGAKPLGLGGAFAGASGDINCLFYNPAGLATSKGVIVSGGDIHNYSLGVAYGTSIGNFGIGAVYKNYEDFKLNETLKASYEHDLALVSYGVGPDWISIGITFKSILSQRLSIKGIPNKTSSIGSDYDAGVLWKPINYASIGVMIRNGSGTEYTLGSSEESFPKSTRAGLVLGILGRNSIFYNEAFGFKAAYDVENGNAGGNQTHNNFYGAELSFNNWLFARFGGSSTFNIDKNVASSSSGLGIKLKDAEIDLASLKDPVTGSQISFLSLSYSPLIFELFKAPEAAKAAAVTKELVKLDFPKDDYVTYDENVIMSGEANPKTTVLINGAQVYISDDGKFSAVQPLNPGKNLIKITASDAAAGYESKPIIRKVLRKAKVLIEGEAEIDKKIAREVLGKEAEISRKEIAIKKEKEKGIDVSKKESSLIAEKTRYLNNKEKLLNEKKNIDVRKEKVENLVMLGVIEVSPRTKFQIESPITRGEMISWLVKASGLAIPKVEGPVFVDVPKKHKYAPFIKAALDAGLIKGEADGKFRPDDPAKEVEGQSFFKAFGIVK